MNVSADFRKLHHSHNSHSWLDNICCCYYWTRILCSILSSLEHVNLRAPCTERWGPTCGSGNQGHKVLPVVSQSWWPANPASGGKSLIKSHVNLHQKRALHTFIDSFTFGMRHYFYPVWYSNFLTFIFSYLRRWRTKKAWRASARGATWSGFSAFFCQE